MKWTNCPCAVLSSARYLPSGSSDSPGLRLSIAWLGHQSDRGDFCFLTPCDTYEACLSVPGARLPCTIPAALGSLFMWKGGYPEELSCWAMIPRGFMWVFRGLFHCRAVFFGSDCWDASAWIVCALVFPSAERRGGTGGIRL